MALDSLFCADVPLSNYSLTIAQLDVRMLGTVDQRATSTLGWSKHNTKSPEI